MGNTLRSLSRWKVSRHDEHWLWAPGMKHSLEHLRLWNQSHGSRRSLTWVSLLLLKLHLKRLLLLHQSRIVSVEGDVADKIVEELVDIFQKRIRDLVEAHSTQLDTSGATSSVLEDDHVPMVHLLLLLRCELMTTDYDSMLSRMSLEPRMSRVSWWDSLRLTLRMTLRMSWLKSLRMSLWMSLRMPNLWNLRTWSRKSSRMRSWWWWSQHRHSKHPLLRRWMRHHLRRSLSERMNLWWWWCLLSSHLLRLCHVLLVAHVRLIYHLLIHLRLEPQYVVTLLKVPNHALMHLELFFRVFHLRLQSLDPIRQRVHHQFVFIFQIHFSSVEARCRLGHFDHLPLFRR